MADTIENTLSSYLGPEFQQHLMWQLLVEPEFAEKIIPDLAIEYFDDPNLRRLFIIILEYFKEFEKVPNLQNQSIHQAINKYKTPNNVIEEESLFAVIKRIELWNERIINKQMLYDGDVIQKSTNSFIKQQEYRKLAEGIIDKVKNGEIKSKYVIAAIEEKFQKITHIGEDEDDCEEVTEGIEKAMRKEFRQPIPTGIGVIDSLTGGGLGKGEIGLILSPSGAGKSTALTVIANTAYEQEKNVAQIIFEDTKDQIKRKHYTIWAKSALSKLDDEEENIKVTKIVHEKAKSLEGKGRLVIKKFSQENTTMLDVKNWMIGFQKKYGFKFDILVLDYLDCLESHKKSPDRTEAELQIVKAFEALASDFDIPGWSALQGNRSSFNSGLVEAQQIGGSIKRVQKAHFFMSIAKTKEQQEANFASIRIIKARFCKDGQTFEDCIFNNDTMQIIITDPKYPVKNKLKHYDENDINNVENTANKMHAVVSQLAEDSKNVGDLVNTVVPSTVNDAVNMSPAEINRLLQNNSEFEIEQNTVKENDIVIKTNIDEPTVKKEELVVIKTEPIETESNDFIEQMRREIEDEIHGVSIKQIENIHISTTRTDLKQNEIKEVIGIANEAIIEINGVVEEANEEEIHSEAIFHEEQVKRDEEKEPFEWNGESGKTTIETINQPEVKLEDIKESLDLTKFIPPGVFVKEIDNNIVEKNIEIKEEKLLIKPLIERINKNINVKELENKLLIDIDEPQDNEKSVFNILNKARQNQRVIKDD